MSEESGKINKDSGGKNRKPVMVGIFLVFLCGMIVLGLIKSGGLTESRVETDDSMPTPYPNDKNSIYIWWDSSIHAQTVVNEAIDEFHSKNPKYKDIHMEAYTPASQDRNALEVQINGGTAPSIVKMDHIYVGALGANGDLENLADPRYGAGKLKNKFVEATWKAVSSKDAVYGLPFDANTIGLVSNMDILDKVGKGVPQNYDDMLEVIEAAGKTGGDIYGFTGYIPDGRRTSLAIVGYLSWFWRMGADILSEDLTHAVFNEEAGVEALNKMIELSKQEGYVNYGEGYFNAGKVATMEMGSWVIPSMNNKNWFLSKLPVLKEGVPPYSCLGLFALCVVSDSRGWDRKAFDKSKVCYEFVQYMATNKDYQHDYCEAYNLTPSLIEAQQLPPFTEGTQKMFVDQMKISKARPNVECWPQIEEVLEAAIISVIDGERSTKDALDAAAKVVDQLLAKERE
jgi:multiple sugar transport system substrate-binding protein